MSRTRKRSALPRVDQLEVRQLLSVSGQWIGQDRHDLVGRSSRPGPSGVQDIHLSLSGLPAGRAVAAATVRGDGGGEWVYHGSTSAWAAAFVRTDPTRGELYLEPYRVETGRPFEVLLRYDDGTTVSTTITGGTADPNLRMPGSALRLSWIGQDGTDRVGPGPAVGPDGIQDARLALSNLTPGAAIEAVRVEGPPGISWTFGPNREGASNAELVRDPADPSRATLSINPDRDLAGLDLSVMVIYASGATDEAVVTAGATSATLAVAAPPAPPSRVAGVTVRWLGQDGLDPAGQGDVHLAVEGLPADRTIRAAVLTDEAGLSWAYQAGPDAPVYADPFSRPLGLRASPGRAEVTFTPRRDENGSTLSLRLVLDDGSIAVASVVGDSMDLGRIAPGPAATSVLAHPGDDLNDLANRYGSVRLSAGRYDLDRPLVLNNPVSITADPGATLIFTQPASAPAWTAAIKVHASHTTLDGFAVRFAGPVRWDDGVAYGPAVVGTTDDRDNRLNATKIDLAFTNLDIEAPPVPTSSSFVPAPSLFRLVTAESGRIESNTLKGGTIEVIGGPWRIAGNDYRGTVPGTYTDAVIAGHWTRDLVVENNRAEPRGPSGKTWRFLVLTGTGFNDRVESNTVVGVGPRDDDTIPQANATEIILTESYRLKFEGRPLAVSPDGLVVQVPQPQGGPAQAGDVVAVLDGPDAGQWRRVVQVVDARTYLLDAPLPSSVAAISIASGFVQETFQGNTVDTRGSSLAANLVLSGSHYGTRVLDNRLLGGRYAIMAVSSPTEAPVMWGWSHSPQLGMVLDGNTLIDAAEGSVVRVDHDSPAKSNKGRVYWTGTIANTTFGFSPAFVAAHPQPRALSLGDGGSIDPDEQVVSLVGSVSRGASSTVVIHAARVNGQTRLDESLTLPQTFLDAPGGLSLARDTGVRGTDAITSDATLRFHAVPGAIGYEYRVGQSGPFLPLGASTTFVPAGLTDGSRVVFVRAIDEFGSRGPASVLPFVLDTTAPPAVPGLSAVGQTIQFSATSPTDQYEYRVGDGAFRPLGSITRFNPSGLAYGANIVAVRATDLAGNIGPEAAVRVDVPLPVVRGTWVGQDGSDHVGPGPALGPDGFQDVHLMLTGLRVDRAIASVTVTGLGGGIWSSQPVGQTWRAAVTRSADLTQADLYIQPYQRETGRLYQVIVRYEDGTTVDAWLAGGVVDPARRANVAPGPPAPAGQMSPAKAAIHFYGKRWARLRMRRAIRRGAR
jgi:hypothetical protein